MKTSALVSKFTAVCAALVFFSVATSGAKAQPTPDVQAVKPASPEELSQAELLKSYLQVRDQLHATQLAVVNNRVEAETAARVQAAAIAEKLDAIKTTMLAERERHQAETERLNAERERQQLESQRSIRTVLWVAASFGCLGLIAMLVMPLFQWRAINRMAEAAAGRTQLTTGESAPALLGGDAAGPTDQTVSVSNQRLMSVIDRMEQRIRELEHTATPTQPSETDGHKNGVDLAPYPTLAASADTSTSASHHSAAASSTIDRNGIVVEVVERTGAAHGISSQVATLLSKARSLSTTNKAKEAIAAYEEILGLDADNREALLKKGAALERLMRNEEAIKCYDRVIAIDAKMTLAYLYKGGVCNRLGRYDEALECYELAMQVQEEGK